MNNKFKLFASSLFILCGVASLQANDSTVIIVKPQSTGSILKLQAVPTENAPPFTKGITYDVYAIDSDGHRAKNSIKSASDVGGVVFKGLKPGRYYIVAMLTEANKIKVSLTVDLTRSHKAFYIFDMNVGILRLRINTISSTIMDHIYYEVETDNLANNSRKSIYTVTNNYHSQTRGSTGRKPMLDISPTNGKHTFYLRPGKYLVSAGEYFPRGHKWKPIKQQKIVIQLNRATEHTFNLNNK